MKDIKEQKELEDLGRRKAVKTIVGGVTAVAAYSLLPQTWEKPIIESIFLPAHAATSGSSLHDPCEVTRVSGYQDDTTVVINVSGFVTPPTGNLPTTIVAMGSPDTSATSTVTTTTADDGTFSAQITLTTTGLGSVAVTTTVEGADGSANCSVDIPERAEEEPEEEPECGTNEFTVTNNTSNRVTVSYYKCDGIQYSIDLEADTLPLIVLASTTTPEVILAAPDGAFDPPAVIYTWAGGTSTGLIERLDSTVYSSITVDAIRDEG